MPDTPRPSTRVIPLHPDRAAALPQPIANALMQSVRNSALLRTCLSARLPAGTSALVRDGAGKAASFLAPGVLLAAGTALLGLLVGCVMVALGAAWADPVTIGSTAGCWTLLATTGCALALRGYRLARSRWI